MKSLSTEWHYGDTPKHAKEVAALNINITTCTVYDHTICYITTDAYTYQHFYICKC